MSDENNDKHEDYMPREYLVSFSVMNKVDSTISINTTPASVIGMISQAVIFELAQRIAQEWYLHHMGEEWMTTPTDPMHPLEDFNVCITGMILIEAEDDGKLKPYFVTD